MKVVIDISEDVYTRLFDNGIQDNEIAVDDICEIARAIRLGTPIKALEQEPCEDCISRQAALDCFTATKLKKFDFILYAREEIKKLPSVTSAEKQEPCEELDFVQPHKKIAVNLEVCKMREATQEEREGVERYIDSIAKDVPDNNVGECDDCISRQAAIDACDQSINVLDATDRIKALPPVTPAEKVGQWIMHIDDLFPAESTMECNKCHEHQPITIDDNYCPNCGSYNGGGDNGNE